jgi:hypothetical protein
MEGGTIKLEPIIVPGISEHTWHKDQVDTADLSSIKKWDLSHNNLMDSGLRYLDDKTAPGPWEAMTSIDLSYNRLSPHCLPYLISWMRKFPKALVNLSYNSMNSKDMCLESLPEDIRQRVKIDYHFDKEFEVMEGRLKRSARDMSQIQGWQKIEDDVLEEQMTRFLQDYYQGEGYSVDPVEVRKIYTREGQVCAELDGLLIAEREKESMLLTVEAKHSLREDDITGRRKKLGKFIDFLANIPDEDDKNASMKFRILCNQLRLCKGWRLEHYIGAVYVPKSVKSLAQKNGFNVLQYRGDRYDMAKATGSFVPLKEA